MRTALYNRHLALGAKIVDFGGFEMPLQYEGVLKEHQHVREQTGLFDVSHMGRIDIQGLKSEQFLDYLSTNRIQGMRPKKAVYTVLCNESGYAVDDVIIFKISDDHFFLVANATNRETDLEHLKKYAKPFDVTITPRFEGYGILALQGPYAKEILKVDLPPMRMIEHKEMIISSTGYTGSGGFEIYGPEKNIADFFDDFLKKGALPCGLGARDTLRLEMGYALYGHELSLEIKPSESVSAWTIRGDKDFLGKEHQTSSRKSYGVILDDKAIARAGSSVFQDKREIGFVTSGNFSPSLEKSIALLLVDQTLNEGDRVEIAIRKRQFAATVVKLPFLQI